MHVRLAVIGHDDDGEPPPPLRRASAASASAADRVVAAAQRLERRVGPALLLGVVVVLEIEDEEVEGVARHEPAPDGRRVRVDRARRTGRAARAVPRVRSALKRL